MNADLSDNLSALSADLACDWSRLGYTQRASALVGVESLVNAPLAAHESQEDFLGALQVLGAESWADRGRGEGPGMRFLPVFVSCPADTWTTVFGGPERLTECHEAPVRLPVCAWYHQCVDGPVACVGHFYERSPGVRWVIVARVLPPRSETLPTSDRLARFRPR